MRREKDSQRDLWGNIKCTDIHIIGAPGGEERERRLKEIFEEIIAENFPNTGKETVKSRKQPQKVSGTINRRRNTSRHIAIKMTKKLKTKIKY